MLETSFSCYIKRFPRCKKQGPKDHPKPDFMQRISTGTNPGYESFLVDKPWGYEYLMFQNELVGLWFLYIRHGAGTSLHCHPRKKTGLVLLSGQAEITFLNDSTRLTALSRMMIRPGLFHSTRALSPEGIVLLEVETPRDKENLVRLEDEYGRESKPYEGRDSMRPLPGHCLRFEFGSDEEVRSHELAGCKLSLLKTWHPERLDLSDPGMLLLILEGGLFTEDGQPILAAGDVVTPSTFGRLRKTFSAPGGLALLLISRS